MYKTILLSVTLLLSISLCAQERTVNGKVTCYNKFGLNNVSIIVKSTKQEYKSDSLGFFSFKCDKGEALQFKANGFSSKKVKLKNYPDSVNVDLRFIENSRNVEIATGYGYISKDKLTYAMQNLSGEDFSRYSTILEAIEGKFTSVSITSYGIKMRGASTLNQGDENALLLIDGVKVSFGEFKNIPTTDIKSINVLKGGAAARYGAQGFGGVVVVVTKGGKAK